MPDHRVCGHCAGSGSIPLRADLQRTLNACRYLARRRVDISVNTLRPALSESLDGDPIPTSVLYHRLLLLASLEYLERVASCRRPKRFRLAAVAHQATPAESQEGHAAA